MPASTSLAGLIRWLGRDEWREPFEEVLWLHVGPACEQAGIEFEDVEDILGHHHSMTLWGCAFEDFLTRALEPDGRNLVDHYLRRRGWKETQASKRYMQALRGSVMSLYEVSGIVPGEAFLARDLVRGGEPVRVSERTATRTLAQWERIGARVVEDGGKHVLAGGVLSFAHEASEAVLRVLKTAMKKARRDLGKLGRDADGAGSDAHLDAAAMDRLVLQDAAPVFASLWLADVLPRTLSPSLPTLVNSEGDEIAFHTVRYPLRRGATAEVVRKCLRTVEALREEGETFWNWVEAEASSPATPPRPRQGARPATTSSKRRSYGVTLDDGVRVLGDVELAGDAVLLRANSQARAERGQALLTPLLGELVGAPVSEVQTVEQAVAASPPGDRPPKLTDELPSDVRASIVHETLDRHYRAALDQPVGMLGGRTPRECVKTRAGREKVAGWLKFLEGQSGRGRDAGDPMASYDFGWMWAELGVADLRR